MEGRSGVAKLEACNSALPPTALRVVIVGAGSDEDLERELAGVMESRLLEESPERTVVFMPATAGQDVRVADHTLFVQAFPRYGRRWFRSVAPGRMQQYNGTCKSTSSAFKDTCMEETP